MNKQSRRITCNKFYFLLIVFLFSLVIARLFYVALATEVDGTNIKKFALSRNTKTEILYASRGNIMDISGEILAQNVTSYTVIAYLSSTRTTNANNPQHVVDKEMTAEALSPIINMSAENILKLLNRSAYQVELGPGGRGITETTKKTIENLELPGISFIKGEKRNYPYNNFASYIIGYAKKDDSEEINGEMGIESYYNNQLKGTDGKKTYQQDINGYQIADTPVIEESSVTGDDIYLTIDSNIQMFLENAMSDMVSEYSPTWSILTVMDAKTGAIVGSSTYPSFDPNKLNITQYNNPLISYTYEPGSTMKIFSYMAAMENNVYKADELYKSGTIEVKGTTIKDHNTVGWGKIAYDTGFTYSSNVAATLLAQKMEANEKGTLKDYYSTLGFGVKTGIELSGELPGKINFKYDVEVANASFGQGMTVTPIQMLKAMSAVTNNGVMLQPYVVSKVVDTNTNEVVYEGSRTELGTVASEDTISEIKRLMNLTVNGEGNVTGKSYKTDSVSLIGKTGTAEKVGKDGTYLDGKYDYIRSFIGCFPYEEPEYIIYLVTDSLQGTSSTLGKVIKTVVENISKNKYLSDSKDNDKNDIYEVDNYISKTQEDVIKTLETDGVSYLIIGDGTNIINQYPSKGVEIAKDTKILLLTDGNNIALPDLLGWSSNDVINYCNITGMKCNFSNYGNVTSYSLEAGTLITSNSIINIDLEPISSKIESEENEVKDEKNN